MEKQKNAMEHQWELMENTQKQMQTEVGGNQWKADGKAIALIASQS